MLVKLPFYIWLSGLMLQVSEKTLAWSTQLLILAIEEEENLDD